MDLWGFLSRELWLFLLAGILLALIFPQSGLHFTPYAIYFLLFVMFFTSLSIGLSDIGRAFSRARLLAKTLLLVFVLSPLMAFAIACFLEEQVALGLILYSTIPSAMANAFYIKRMGHDAALALAITAVTTLLAPFVAPWIVLLFSGAFVTIDPLALFGSLIKLVFIPFVAAEVLRLKSRRLSKKLLEVSPPLTNICIFFVVFGVISAAAGEVFTHLDIAIVMAFFLAASFILAYVVGSEDRTVLAFGNGFRNGTLAMVVALEVFGPTAALIGIMSTLVHNSILVPLLFAKDLGKRRKK